jgi:transposase
MKRTVNYFPDEVKLQVIQEFISTDMSLKELMEKFNIGGGGTIYKWMRKFGMQGPNSKQIEIQRVMAEQKAQTPYEQELEARVKQLEEQLKYERLRTLALNTMIDIAERDLKISIRKKSGAKQSKP